MLQRNFQWRVERHFFVRASEHLGRTPLTGMGVNNSKKSAIFDQILVKDHDASFEDFTILLKENNKFKLHLKQSFLIKCDKPELDKNIYSYPWLIAFTIFILLFTYLPTWVNYTCNFHDSLSIVDSSSLLLENASDQRRKRKLF